MVIVHQIESVNDVTNCPNLCNDSGVEKDNFADIANRTLNNSGRGKLLSHNIIL